MENKAYLDRLEELKLPSLEYRRKRADVIQTYKIMDNIDRIDGKKFFKPGKEVRTRGHSKRVEKLHARASSGAIHSAKEWRMTGMHCQMLSL